MDKSDGRAISKSETADRERVGLSRLRGAEWTVKGAAASSLHQGSAARQIR